ncbi:MAG: ATP synthase F1 subunit delta [Candidatus Eisenbacteria sp.]|nr:ATP synthase F1 subunit delta [Candidatus Eisenbacteria bacterium]
MNRDPVARRYARALFGAAAARDLLDEIIADLPALVGFLRRSPGARRLLVTSPFSTAERQELVRRLFGGQVHPLILELLLLLIEKHRFELLEDVDAGFRALYEARRGILRVAVTTAIPLPEDLAARLSAALAARTGKHITLEPQVDPALLGGMRVRIGDRVIEHSVRRNLETVRERLREVAVYD